VKSAVYQIPFCGNTDLVTGLPGVTRAVIVIHGNNRDADVDQTIMDKGAATVGSNALIIAPQFLIGDDLTDNGLDTSYLFWTKNNGSWKYGYPADSTALYPSSNRVSSFTVLDSLIRRIVTIMPDLRHLVIAGHSAGGQLVQRYVGGFDRGSIDTSVCFRFITGNGSSYMYLDSTRVDSGTVDQFSIPSQAKQDSCSNYDRYRYGLSEFDYCDYMENIGADSIRARMGRRELIIMLGEDDNDPNHPSLNIGCKAAMQGAHRLERGIIFYNHLIDHFGSGLSNKELLTFPGVGHDASPLFRSQIGLYYIFGDSVHVGIDPIESNPFRLHPNPADHELYIKTERRDTKYQILDLLGRTRLQGDLNRNTAIDIQTLPVGIYLVTLTHPESEVPYVLRFAKR
jgi:hypothetical protein